MSATGETASDADEAGGGGTADLKLEVVVIAVASVDRAKEFYQRLGWRLDADFPFDNGFRIVQFTPPGSGTSVQFGTKMTSAARGQLAARGAEVSEVFHPEAPGAQFAPDAGGQVRGRASDGASYGSFAT